MFSELLYEWLATSQVPLGIGKVNFVDCFDNQMGIHLFFLVPGCYHIKILVNFQFGLTCKGFPRKRPPRAGEGRPWWKREGNGTWEKKAAVVGGQEKYWPRRRRHPTLR